MTDAEVVLFVAGVYEPDNRRRLTPAVEALLGEEVIESRLAAAVRALYVFGLLKDAKSLVLVDHRWLGVLPPKTTEAGESWWYDLSMVSAAITKPPAKARTHLIVNLDD